MKQKIVIIGSGLAGSLLCNELAKTCDVTLLEKGGKNSITFPTIHFVKKKLAEVNTICYSGGGTTNLWHNGLIPILPGDVASGSPFQEVLRDAQTYTDAAAASLFFDQRPFSAEYRHMVSEFSDRAARVGLAPEGIDCLVYPKKYRKLTVVPQVKDYYDVDSIDFAAENGKIKTVMFARGADVQTLVADRVIVSAGTLGTPGILGKILEAAGVKFDQLGVGFIDHPMGFVGKVRFKKDMAGLIRDLSSSDRGEYVSRNALRIKSDCGRYTCGVFFRPALTMDNRLSIYKFKSSLGASNGMARIKNACSPKLFHPDIIAEIVSHLFGFNIPSRTYNILLIADQKRGSNRVYCKGDDLQVDWCITDEELSIYRGILKKLSDMLADVAEEINIETDIGEQWLWSAAHHSCTTPLGDSEADLIDKDLKLKFCDNVYVCDGSVIQEHSYANTGLTIGQLAFRLARRIRDAG